MMNDIHVYFDPLGHSVGGYVIQDKHVFYYTLAYCVMWLMITTNTFTTIRYKTVQ